MKTMLIVVMLGLVLGVVVSAGGGHVSSAPAVISGETLTGPQFENLQALGSDSTILLADNGEEEEEEDEGEPEEQEKEEGGSDRRWDAPKLG